jgi:hypothetical protein
VVALPHPIFSVPSFMASRRSIGATMSSVYQSRSLMPAAIAGDIRSVTPLAGSTAGLAWVIGKGRVVAITADTAVILMPSGSRLTYRRRPVDPAAILPGFWPPKAEQMA